MIFLSFKEVLGDIGAKIFPSWQAVIVQLLATAFLVFIATKFFYRPVKEFISKRQEYVNRQITEADEKIEEANRILKEAQEHHVSNLKESNKLLNDSKIEAEKQKEIILESARQEANGIKENAFKNIDLEKKKARKEIKKEVVELSMEISKNILQRELNDGDKENAFNELLEEVQNDE